MCEFASFCFVETGFYIVQAGIELPVWLSMSLVLLSPLPECWDYMFHHAVFRYY